MTLCEAQDRYIARVNTCHPGHKRRVKRSAWKQLSDYARERGYDPKLVCVDADDMAKLEQLAED